MITRILAIACLHMSMLFAMHVQAAESNVYKQSVKATMEKVYPAVYESLENARFFVVFEPKISDNLQRFAERWGENHNRNKLDSIRSMVFCNAWYANEVSNADPDMLGLCPLRVGLYEKQGVTTVVFARPSVIGEHSKAKDVLLEVEKEIIEAIKNGLNKF